MSALAEMCLLTCCVTFNSVAAKEMIDNVCVTVYNANGDAVSKHRGHQG